MIDNSPNFHPSSGSRGCSLRDYFAAQALVGLLAREEWDVDIAARAAYEYAEAMLRKREGEGK
jgi:hypothetical protein